MAAAKKRKVDTENRFFNEHWTEEYAFESDQVSKKPICLICLDTVAVNKSANIKRHMEIKHKDFNTKYPKGSPSRTAMIKQLQAARGRQVVGLAAFTSVQKRSTEASLKVSAILAKSMVPYSHGEIIKECIQAATQTLFPKNRDINSAIEGLSLSRKTVVNRVQNISEHFFNKLIADVKKSNGFSLALDESTDNRDIAQLSVFVRFYLDGCGFVEELLTVLPLESKTTGENIYDSITSFLREHVIPVDKIISVSTDGAPAMSGSVNGLAGRLKQDNNNILFFHCIIHQAVLCCKLPDNIKNVMTRIMQLINYLKSHSSLRHRQLKQFLLDLNSQYSDLLTHNDVRWLSKGQSMNRFWQLKDPVKDFLRTINSGAAQSHLDDITSDDFMTKTAFLTDLFGHMNALNKKLQGKEVVVTDLWTEIKSFKLKLRLFLADIKKDRLHFPILNEFLAAIDAVSVPEEFYEIICNIKNQFDIRFGQFETIEPVLNFIENPASHTGTEEHLLSQLKTHFNDISIAALQLELCDVAVVADQFTTTSTVSFYTSPVTREKYPTLAKLGLRVLSIFGSTYECECMFSSMNHVKNSNRTQLTNEHLQDLLRVATHEPITSSDISAIMANKSVFHTSH